MSDLKALAIRIAKLKSKSENKAYIYPGPTKKDVVSLFSQDRSKPKIANPNAQNVWAG